MRNAIWVFAAVLLLNSCSLFEKPSMTQEQIDAMVAENRALEDELASIEAKYEAEISKIKAEQAQMLQEEENQSIPSSGTYYVIVGSFKTPKYADDFAERIKNMGGEGMIIDGPMDFSLVTNSGHATLREASRAMQEARLNIVSGAWIYKVN